MFRVEGLELRFQRLVSSRADFGRGALLGARAGLVGHGSKDHTLSRLRLGLKQ